MSAKPFNFWPLSIAGFIGVVVLLIVWTVYFALQNPVQRDDSFLASYQEADALINTIQEEQKQFTAHYRLVWQGIDSTSPSANPPQAASHSRAQNIAASFDSLAFPEGFAFRIEPREGAPLPRVVGIEALLTRPHTKESDQILTFAPDGALLRSQPIELPAHGRWLIQGVIHYEVEDSPASPKTGYFRFEFFAKDGA